MSNYNYEICLRPVENYFFGGERTFGQAQDEQSNYFAVSNKYPQQTALLGLLRYLLLEHNQWLPLKDHKTEASKAIGDRSFDVKMEATQDFGVIQSLSPLFMKRAEEVFRFTHPLDQLRLSLEEKVEALGANGQTGPLVKPEGFNSKTYYPELLIGDQGDRSVHSDVFLKKEQIGILKQSEKDGFFKQASYHLSKGWYFSFYVHLEGSFVLPEEAKVSFGAEQKQFFVQVKSIKSQDLPSFLKPGEGSDKLTLLSDALVDGSIYEHCRFSLSDTVDFRTVQIGFEGAKFRKDSVKHNLLKRGSILIPKAGQMGDLESALQQNQNFRNIGFNHYFKSNL
ncbi:MAG: type III-B CRISPR module-associated Cmr3 family protein [Bacteroidota bacterium]